MEMTLSVDNLERLEHILDIIIEMHDLFGISLEEAAGRFDQYAQTYKRFVTGWAFFHASIEDLACWVYYGIDEWQGELRFDPVRWLNPAERERNGYDPLRPKTFP